MFRFAEPRPRRRPSLTPMIDVVFLLLVFFMVAARFGAEAAVPLVLSGGGATYEGPPRLVDVLPEGLRLNGVAATPEAVLAELGRLTSSAADVIVLRSVEGADVQRLGDVIGLLRDGGFTAIALIGEDG